MTRRVAIVLLARPLLSIGCRFPLVHGTLEAAGSLDSAIVALLSDVAPVVDATIEGEHEAVLIRDTGAGASVVSAAAADRWGTSTFRMREVDVPTARGSVRLRF